MVTSVATITRCNDIVIVGSGALKSAAKHLPADLMVTDELDLYVRDATDPEDVQQLIEGALGEGTYFQKAFRCENHMPGCGRLGGLDLAVSKCVAWREKDKEWLKLCALHGIVDLDRMRELVGRIGPAKLGELQASDVVARIDHMPMSPTKRSGPG